MCRTLKNPKQTEYKAIFYYAKNALREKKTLNPNFHYILAYIFQYCCITMFSRNGTMLVCTFLLRCSVIDKTSRIIAKTLFFRLFCIFFCTSWYQIIMNNNEVCYNVYGSLGVWESLKTTWHQHNTQRFWENVCLFTSTACLFFLAENSLRIC